MAGTAAGIKATKAHDQPGLPAQDAVWVLEQAAADQQRSTRRFALRWLPTSLSPLLCLPGMLGREHSLQQSRECGHLQPRFLSNPPCAAPVLSCLKFVAPATYVSLLACIGEALEFGTHNGRVCLLVRGWVRWGC